MTCWPLFLLREWVKERRECWAGYAVQMAVNGGSGLLIFVRRAGKTSAQGNRRGPGDHLQGLSQAIRRDVPPRDGERPLPLALVNLMQTVTAVVDWLRDWWTDLAPGDRGTWFGGIATALAVIIAFATVLQQRREALKLRQADQDAKRSHAEKFSCWVAGSIKKDDVNHEVHIGELVVALTNASEQPFTEAVVEVELKEAQAPRRFTISVVPPGTSWFAFDSNLKQPQTLILPIWFLDNGVGTWTRSSVGALEVSTRELRSDKWGNADRVWLNRGDPTVLGPLNDAWAPPLVITASGSV
jgi:hypothetical protein